MTDGKKDEIDEAAFREWISPTSSEMDIPYRYYLPDERPSRTVKFTIYPQNEDDPNKPPPPSVEGKFIVGFYPDGTPGELFVEVEKQGSEIHGWADCWAISVSLLLQYGVPPSKIYEKFMYQIFKPQGMTRTPEAPFCKSIIDLIMKWMSKKLPPTAKVEVDGYEAIIESVVDGENQE